MSLCFVTWTFYFSYFSFFHMEEVVLVRFLNLASLPFFMCLQACYIVNLHSKNIEGEGTFCHSNIANSSASEGRCPSDSQAGRRPCTQTGGPSAPRPPDFQSFFFLVILMPDRPISMGDPHSGFVRKSGFWKLRNPENPDFWNSEWQKRFPLRFKQL